MFFASYDIGVSFSNAPCMANIPALAAANVPGAVTGAARVKS